MANDDLLRREEDDEGTTPGQDTPSPPIPDPTGGPLRRCCGCSCPILDQFILRVAPDLEWHATCLRCAECLTLLEEMRTCFVRDGKTFCKQDYHRLFGVKCSQCSLGFNTDDLVMRAKSLVYHVDCFRCVLCSRTLVPGDEFALRSDGLFCRADHDLVTSRYKTTPTSGDRVTPRYKVVPTSVHNPSVLKGNQEEVEEEEEEGRIDDVSFNNNDNETKVTIIADGPTAPPQGTPVPPHPAGGRHGSAQHGRSKLGGSHRYSDHSGGGGGGGGGHRHHQKTTRVRTVLNEKQLHTLRTCYGANPRPDALMKEQLVEMTGLSPRVIRVWFQNKRCKDKKRSILIKQLQLQQDKNEICIDDTWLCRKIDSSQDSPVGPDGLMHSVDSMQQYHSHQQLLQLQQQLDHGQGLQQQQQQQQQQHGKEDTQLQSPWKALTNFALQGVSSLDPVPPFHRLVSSFGSGGSGETSEDEGEGGGEGEGEEEEGEEDDTVVTLSERHPTRGGAGGGGRRAPPQSMRQVGLLRGNSRRQMPQPLQELSHQHQQQQHQQPAIASGCGEGGVTPGYNQGGPGGVTLGYKQGAPGAVMMSMQGTSLDAGSYVRTFTNQQPADMTSFIGEQDVMTSFSDTHEQMTQQSMNDNLYGPTSLGQRLVV